MKRIIMFVLLFAALKVAGQTTGYFRFDTVRIMKQNGTCELYIINKTKDTLGLLTNIGGGLTSFKRPRVINDSQIVVGIDTLTIPGSGGSGSPSGNFAPLNIADTSARLKPLILFVGESNPMGVISNTGLSGAETSAFPRIQILHNSNFQFQSLQIGVNNNIQVNSALTNHGMELQLMKSIQAGNAFLSDTVFLVKVGRSAATIQSLIDSLPTSIRRIDSAVLHMQQLGYYPQVYIWYSQGINDGATDSATWLKNTEYYLTQLRNHAGYAPVFHTKLIGAGVTRNNTIAQIPYWDGFSYIVNTDGLTTGDPNHWDSTGLAEICKSMINLSVDTVYQRNLYTQTQANKIKKGYAGLSLLKVDRDAEIANMTISGSFSNHFFGNKAGLKTTTGNFNTITGYESFEDGTTGSNNSAYGYRSLRRITTASDNSAFGSLSLTALTSGIDNSAFGANTLTNNTTGFSNTGFGSKCLNINVTGNGNTGVGSGALEHSTGDGNTAIGYLALNSTTSGVYNVAIGQQALQSNTTGNHNFAGGLGALQNSISGIRNIAFGTNTLRDCTGSSNVAIGVEAGMSITGSNNTIVGDQALFGPAGLSGMVVIGATAGQNAAASNKLIIDNSPTANPLIHGDFANDSLKVNGYLKVRDMDSAASPANMVWRDPTTKELKLAAVPSATTLYGGDGTLAGNRTVSGGSNSLQLGAFGSQLSSLSVWSAGRINLNGQPAYSTSDHSTDANLTVPANVGFVELHDNLTTDRTVTLPSASAQGQTITFVVRASGGSNHFNLASGVPDNKTGSTFTQLDWGTTYVFYVNASVAWSLINKY